jgi:hypothetical protein
MDMTSRQVSRSAKSGREAAGRKRIWMRESVRFSLATFGPILVLLLLPVPFLCFSCVMMILISMTGGNPGQAKEVFMHCMWTVGPLAFAALTIFWGIIVWNIGTGHSSRIVKWLLVWLTLSLEFFAVSFYGVVVLC